MWYGNALQYQEYVDERSSEKLELDQLERIRELEEQQEAFAFQLLLYILAAIGVSFIGLLLWSFLRDQPQQMEMGEFTPAWKCGKGEYSTYKMDNSCVPLKK